MRSAEIFQTPTIPFEARQQLKSLCLSFVFFKYNNIISHVYIYCLNFEILLHFQSVVSKKTCISMYTLNVLMRELLLGAAFVSTSTVLGLDWVYNKMMIII